MRSTLGSGKGWWDRIDLRKGGWNATSQWHDGDCVVVRRSAVVVVDNCSEFCNLRKIKVARFESDFTAIIIVTLTRNNLGNHHVWMTKRIVAVAHDDDSA